MSTFELVIGSIVVVWGFVCLLALVVLCACWVAKDDDEEAADELAVRRRRRFQERETASTLRPVSGNVLAFPDFTNRARDVCASGRLTNDRGGR